MNPNGKLWSNSDNVGKQMIQKLGWTEGDGLGRDKQGTKTHIKVSLKNDRNGVGAKAGNGSHNAGLLQTFDYDMLLKSKCAELKGSSIEEPITRGMSRAKFGRAVRPDFFKPLDANDWNNILGSSTSHKTVSESNENSKILEKNPTEPDQDMETKFVTKNVNISQYFEMQLKQKREKLHLAKPELNLKREQSQPDAESHSQKQKRMKIEEVELNIKKVDLQLLEGNFTVVNEESANRTKKRSKKMKHEKTATSLTQTKDVCEEDFNGSQSPKKIKTEMAAEEIYHEINNAQKKFLSNDDLINNNKKIKILEVESNEEERPDTQACKKSKKKGRKQTKDTKVDIETSEYIASELPQSSFELQLNESERKLIEIEEFLSNEPIQIENKLRTSLTPLTIVKEPVLEFVNYKVEELIPNVYRSPLDTSNIRDIKGYKYY